MRDFQYCGLPINTNVVWGGVRRFIGSIYAPEAALILGAGAGNTLEYQGACAADSVWLNGNLNLHFDENITGAGPTR